MDSFAVTVPHVAFLQLDVILDNKLDSCFLTLKMSRVSRLILYYETVQQFINGDKDNRVKRENQRTKSVPLKRNYDKRSHSAAVFIDKSVTPSRFNNKETGTKGYSEVPPKQSVSSGKQNSLHLQLKTSVSKGTEHLKTESTDDDIKQKEHLKTEKTEDIKEKEHLKTESTDEDIKRIEHLKTEKTDEDIKQIEHLKKEKTDDIKQIEHLKTEKTETRAIGYSEVAPKQSVSSGTQNSLDLQLNTSVSEGTDERDGSKRAHKKEEDRSSQQVVYPGKEDIITVSKVVCSKSAVSCVSRTDKNEAGEDVRVPISGGARMSNTSPPVLSPQTREMKPGLPLNLMELNLARTEESASEREIVLVHNKTKAEMTGGETREQNKDLDGDVNQDEGSGWGCDTGTGPQRITSASSHALNLKHSKIFFKELFE